MDEAGRGAWAGPVVAAAVFWLGKCPIKNQLKDSKMLSPNERKKTYHEIRTLAETGKLQIGVGIIGNDSIDTVGIREANRQAMQAALLQINGKQGGIHNAEIRLLIDG